ncbi:histidine phosphatase family protein [Bradyrhizobium sp.]|uniref:histidine phosphatase family protein n=1 Tax=Bradyrhizobium sp. TaxID=376 RepID=UPI001D5636C1|nr:histidine phosphatase family protein [Bradyrhizobium sp.]MBV8700147.1 histidine phosphatase family protein [Bradyrhizobium sp.]MBV8922968.1 histidine phosphatase family protein [Bradyrhizobium sp.]
MVKTIHLVRHGHHALLDRTLCGRMAGVGLDALGCRQMSGCAQLIWPQPSLIQSSPQRRARQSAGILAAHFGVSVEIVAAVDEIDLGEWTARSFSELANDAAWLRWNSHRGASRAPNGESMRELQQRIVGHLERLREEPTDATIVIVSHAEPIRAALLHYRGMALDDFMAIGVDPASISTLFVDRAGIRVSQINQRVPA